MDCDTDYNRGCGGGNVQKAFEFVTQYGLTTEESYSYEAMQGSCKGYREAATISGYEEVNPYDEEALKEAVANQPVSVSVEASGRAFMFYAGGVFAGECGTNLDHAVTVVGYGTSREGNKYWLIKNSWGSQWGEQGYIRIQRDTGATQGLCGLATYPSYPLA